MEPFLPEEILYRKKLGFPTPLSIMFKSELFDFVKDIIDSEQAYKRGYFDKNEIQKILQEHKDGTEDHHRVLWQLLVLELWHREYID